MDFTDESSFSKALELSGSDLGGCNLYVAEAKPKGQFGGVGGRSGGRDGGGVDGGGRGGGGACHWLARSTTYTCYVCGDFGSNIVFEVMSFG